MVQLKLDYKPSSPNHWKNCEAIIKNATEIREYFYAALELRYCMERIAFERRYLRSFDRSPDEELSKNALKRYRPGDYFIRMFPNQIVADRIADFTNVVIEIAKIPCESVVAPDMEWFKETYGRLGYFLHAIEKDIGEDYLKKLQLFIVETHEALRCYLLPADVCNLPPHSEQILSDYSEGKIDRQSMRKRLEISDIPLNLQNPR